jgi:hypothetical protein
MVSLWICLQESRSRTFRDRLHVREAKREGDEKNHAQLNPCVPTGALAGLASFAARSHGRCSVIAQKDANKSCSFTPLGPLLGRLEARAATRPEALVMGSQWIAC